MLWITVKRVIRLGFVNFWRNGYVSLASVLVMTVALLVMSSLIFTRALLVSTLDQIKSKVDINVYMVNSASEDEIMVMQKKIEALTEVAWIVNSSFW